MARTELYFNENEAFAADWLQNLYPGSRVDRRSIAAVRPQDLAGFRRVHCFAGIGGWEYALALAGWPMDRPVWTGSCPCQPFSNAGRRKGIKDERHLWPVFRDLIAECRPTTILGEQTQSAAGREWLAGVRADLEALGYAVGAADLCAASQGAPHIRQRLWWVADSGQQWIRVPGCGTDGESSARVQGPDAERQRVWNDPGSTLPVTTGGLGHAKLSGGPRWSSGQSREGNGASAPGTSTQPGRSGDTGGLGHSYRERQPQRTERDGESERSGVKPSSRIDALRSGNGTDRLGHSVPDGLQDCLERGPETRATGLPGAWSDFLVIPCRDGKSRRTEPGIWPLAHGVPRKLGPGQSRIRRLARASSGNRCGRLRGYGNAIVSQVAATFIQAFLEAESDLNS